MPALKARSNDSILIAIDIQPTFMVGVWEADRVVRRSKFLLRIAQLLDIPILATEQNRGRMGATNHELAPLISNAFAKMTFSCCGCGAFLEALTNLGRRQAILLGVETHICVSQTAVDLLNSGYEVIVCPDAVSARTVEMHKLGMERMRDAGVLPMHTESVAYEWLGSAEHPSFRDALQIVKQSAV